MLHNNLGECGKGGNDAHIFSDNIVVEGLEDGGILDLHEGTERWWYLTPQPPCYSPFLSRHLQPTSPSLPYHFSTGYKFNSHGQNIANAQSYTETSGSLAEINQNWKYWWTVTHLIIQVVLSHEIISYYHWFIMHRWLVIEEVFDCTKLLSSGK